jgi:hypothetical protein
MRRGSRSGRTASRPLRRKSASPTARIVRKVATRPLPASQPRSRQLDVLGRLGVRPVKIVLAMHPIERINALRMMLARSRFDAVKCRVGLKSLWHYGRELNPAAEVVRPNPVHDWSNHAADAAGHLAIGMGPV